MRNQVRHRGDFFTLLLVIVVLFGGCASSRNDAQTIRVQRQAIVPYDIIRIRPASPQWVEDFYLKQANGELKNSPLYASVDREKKNLIFIIDSGARQNEEVACTMVKAQGRELMAEAIAQRFHQKVKGRPYDVIVLGPGLTAIYELLGKKFTPKSVLDSYVEGRVTPATGQIKGQEVFHCALKVAVSLETIKSAGQMLKDLIRKEYYYRNSLEEELQVFDQL